MRLFPGNSTLYVLIYLRQLHGNIETTLTLKTPLKRPSLDPIWTGLFPKVKGLGKIKCPPPPPPNLPISGQMMIKLGRDTLRV